MSNLKKILALALVFALAFSMAAGALTYPPAGYLDGSDINAATLDSIIYLANLGIMNGAPASTEDATTGAITQGFKFMPTDTLTRAQFARMIYSIETGKDNADLYKTSVKTGFADVAASDWFAGYVNYAWLMGWVSGKSATRFDPNGELTLSEAATLLLAYLGYDKADLAKAWPSNAILYGSMKGLFGNGVEESGAVSAPLSRQWASVVITNALDCAFVAKNDAGKYVDVAGGTVKTLKLGTFKTVTGNIVANNRFSIDGGAAVTDNANKFVVKVGATYINFSKEFDTINGKLFTADQNVSNAINVSDAFLGAAVKIMYREVNASKNLIMTYVVTDHKTAAVAKSAITYDGEKVTLGAVVVAKDYAAAQSLDDVTFIVNGTKSTGDALLGGDDDGAALKAYTDALPANTGFTFTSVGGALKIATITTWTFGKVELATIETLPNATPGETTETLTSVKINGVTYTKAAGKIANNANTLLKDDYAIFSVDAISGAISITEVAKTEGAVTYVVEKAAAADDVLAIAGKALKQGNITPAGAYNLIADASNGITNVFNNNVTAYAGGNAYYYANGDVIYLVGIVAAPAAVTSSFLFGSLEIQVLGGAKFTYVVNGLEAGVAKTYTFANIAANAAIEALVPGSLYTLTLTAAGAFTSAAAPAGYVAGVIAAAGVAGTDFVYTAATNTLTDGTDTYLLSGATIYGHTSAYAASATKVLTTLGKDVVFKSTLIAGNVYSVSELYIEQ